MPIGQSSPRPPLPTSIMRQPSDVVAYSMPSAPTCRDGTQWRYTPLWTEPGAYRLWLEAMDAAGNTAASGIFTVQVGEAPVFTRYLPVIHY